MVTIMKNNLNLSYTAVQGTYWMYFGAIIGFSSVFLLAKGYSNTEIGTILALMNILSVFLQPAFANFADRTKRFSLAQITGVFSVVLVALTALLFLFPERSITLTVIFVVLGGLMMSLQPLINSIAFRYSTFESPINYGVARSGGSISYSVLSAVLGGIVLAIGPSAIPGVGLIILVLFLIALYSTDTFYKTTPRIDDGYAQVIKDDTSISFVQFLKRNKVLFVFSIGTLLVFFQNAIINNYLIQIIKPIGGTEGDMGRLFSFMAMLELPGLFFFNNIKRRLGCGNMIKIASVAFIFKVFFTFTATSVMMVYFAFLFQIVSFPFYLAGSVHLVDEVLERGEAVKGQSLITGMMTLSAVFASLLGGMILDSKGPSQLLMISTVLCILGSAVVIMTVGKIKSNR